MVRKSKKIKKEEIVIEKVEVAEEGIVIGKDGQRYQRPDPVVPQEDAVAPDAPIYESLK